VSVFIGGSAMAMVKDVAEGYIIVSEHTFKKFPPADLQGFTVELEKYTREVRGSIAPPNDLESVQRRNRKLQRLNQVQQILNSVRARRNR
jgi:hypothetical protein